MCSAVNHFAACIESVEEVTDARDSTALTIDSAKRRVNIPARRIEKNTDEMSDGELDAFLEREAMKIEKNAAKDENLWKRLTKTTCKAEEMVDLTEESDGEDDMEVEEVEPQSKTTEKVEEASVKPHSTEKEDDLGEEPYDPVTQAENESEKPQQNEEHRQLDSCKHAR
ncbi:MAG: hypothetical protein AAF772_02760, partial [Acidobacteriota bacterium]